MKLTKLIITITEDKYKYIQGLEQGNTDYATTRMLYHAVKKGIPLDKIRAEIEKTTSRYTISRERGAMGQVEWSDRLIKESEVLEIINKYKAESEDKKCR